MPILVEPTFVLPLGSDAALLPRTAALGDAYHELLLANQQRLAHEGRGLITRALTALIGHAFGPLKLHRVVLRIDADNERSRAVARRLGFSEEGRQRQAIFVGGRWRDDVQYSLLADEWPHRRPQR